MSPIVRSLYRLRALVSIMAFGAVLSACVPGIAPDPLGESAPQPAPAPAPQGAQEEAEAAPHGAQPGALPITRAALLLPAGSGLTSDEYLAKSLENAARLALEEFPSIPIDLRIYHTAGDATFAGTMAMRAADEGAQIILGPLYSEEAYIAGRAAAQRGVNVLAFSNDASIAGGNVFAFGPTFESTAARLASYAARKGKERIAIVYGENAAGFAGHEAITRAATRSKAEIVGAESHVFSRNGVVQAAPRIAFLAAANGAEALFLTADTAGALPLVAQTLSEAGLSASSIQYLGLTRWDIPASTLELPSLQGGWFAMPDPERSAAFEARYQAAFGTKAHPVSALAYDAVVVVGTLAKAGEGFSAEALTRKAGFEGANGVFRLRSDGLSERALAIVEVRGGAAVVIDQAPRRARKLGQ